MDAQIFADKVRSLQLVDYRGKPFNPALLRRLL